MEPINATQLYATLADIRAIMDRGFNALSLRFDDLDERTRVVERVTDKMWLFWTFVGIIFMAVVPLWLGKL